MHENVAFMVFRLDWDRVMLTGFALGV